MNLIRRVTHVAVSVCLSIRLCSRLSPCLMLLRLPSGVILQTETNNISIKPTVMKSKGLLLSFSAPTLLVGRQEGHPARKKLRVGLLVVTI